jgi:uncharacterized protein YdhG (YjbR/CyaY superfamily)
VHRPANLLLQAAPGSRAQDEASGAASIRNREAPAAPAVLAWTQLAGAAPGLWAQKGEVTMPAKSSQTGSGGFTAAERAAMQQRAAELRAEGKQGAKKADGLQAVLDAIAKMTPEDRALAERVHATVTATAPNLSPKTWYGMPAYTNAEGKVVVSFKNSGKFSTRYSTLEFQDAANLDDGDVWPVSFALQKWSPAVEQKVVEVLKAAVS